MRPLLVPARRLVEATADQVVATGSSLGTYGVDPVDGDTGYRLAGTNGRREVPEWTREKARTYSVTAYRSNPMATSVIDTYVSFCVGDSGVNWQATNPQVAEVVREFWDDPANRLGSIQELLLRSQMLMGEKLLQLMVAPLSKVVRFAPSDPANISDIINRAGNPLWPVEAVLGNGDNELRFDLVQVNDDTGLREGDAMFWAPWRTLDTDTRGMPFLTPILDWLDSYDTVLSNLIDRTSIARYFALDVTVQGGKPEVDEFVKARGGLHVPPSGSIEVHNDAVTWKPMTVSSGAFEDNAANSSVLTNIASGAGLAKTWLAEPDGANRATSQSMAEPVRRRVGGVQKVWLGQIQELLRYVVDQAVAAKRLQPMVDATDPRTGAVTQVPASQTVTVTGPEIAAADSQITAQVLLNLSTGLDNLVNIGALTPGAAATAARKAWEDYVGVPYVHELDSPTAAPDDVATAVEEATRARTRERHRDPRDYVRDLDGRFADAPGTGHHLKLSTPITTVAPLNEPGQLFHGMPAVIASHDIDVDGGRLGISAHAGDPPRTARLTIGDQSTALAAQDIEKLRRAVVDAQYDDSGSFHAAGVTVKAAGREEVDGESLAAGLTLSYGTSSIRMSRKQSDKMIDQLQEASVASRMETGYGPLDVFIAGQGRVGFRMRSDKGAAEVSFSRSDWLRVNGAISEVIDGLDNDGAEVGDTVKVRTKDGPVQVSWHGERQDIGYSPGSHLTVAPLYAADWGIAVDGEHAGQVLTQIDLAAQSAGAVA